MESFAQSPEQLLAEAIAQRQAEAHAQLRRTQQFDQAFRLLLRTVAAAAGEDRNARCLAAIDEVERILGVQGAPSPSPSSSSSSPAPSPGSADTCTATHIIS